LYNKKLFKYILNGYQVIRFKLNSSQKYEDNENIVLMIDGFKQGGSQQVYIMLLKEYALIFKSVTLVILESSKLDLDVPRLANLEVIYLNSSKFFDVKSGIALSKLLAKLKPNFIIASIFRSQILSAITKPKNSKLIWVEQNTYYNRSRMQWIMMRVLSFRVFRIICTSHRILMITQWKISNRKSVLLPNPINILDSRKLNTTRSDDFVFIGRMVEQKNPLLAIHGFNHFLDQYGELSSSSRMHFIGGGGLLSKANSLSVELGIESKCVFYGDISLEKMFDVLNRSKVLVSTSTIEGFGLARLEALGAGCCVVSTDTGGVEDYLSNLENIGVFIIDGSIENISKFMYKALNKEFWSADGINKRADYVSVFSPSVISKKWLSV
jgi:glycosyltransferase involved in cell wall biosynthesis